MSTVKISELVELTNLGANTSATDILAVDNANNITGRITATTLAKYLYANNTLNVGNNATLLPNMVAQFAGTSNNYVQTNLVNNSGNGSADIVITADTGTDETNYLDLGLNGSTFNYDGFTFGKPLDGYLMVQGNGVEPGGNLIIGTYTEGRDLTISLGSIAEDGHFAKFVYDTGFKLLTKPLFFADGTSQNTSAATLAFSQASFDKANTVTTANTWLQANDASTLAAAKLYADANGGTALAAAKVYTDSSNTWSQANVGSALASAKSYADSLNSAQLDTVFNYADVIFDTANTAQDFADAAFSKANTTATNLIITNSLASGAYTLAGIANSVGSLAFDKANNALANTTGTFNGRLTVSGGANVMNTLFVANGSYDYTNTALVKIVGSTGAFYQPPANPGYMLSITGVDGIASRVINSSYGTGAYALFAGRKGNGTAETPTAVANNDVIARFSGSGYNGSAFTTTGQARIDIVASENFTVANTGSRIEFYNTIPQTNTITKIATFNATEATFAGALYPNKGFIYTPRVVEGNTTSLVIDFSTDSMVKMQCNADCTVSFTNYIPGKVVEVWMTNVSGSQHTVTHGCSSTNATNNATTKNIPASSSMKLQYFSIDVDLANTFVAITQG